VNEHVINITKQPHGIYRLETQLCLPRKPAEIFPFFSDAHNLHQITPPWLRFNVITPHPIPMHPGALIDYRLRIHFIPIRWQTVITHWNPPHGFIDEQKHGPYRLWRHTHTFEEQTNGTLAKDTVDYAAPGGPLVHRLLVRPRVEQIFRFRQQKLSELFASPITAHATT
jgi:ligand-binding SRPBCC domain-containing protein